MALFIGTLLIMILCCGLLALAASVSGKPIPGGCGKEVPDAAKCQNCPHRKRKSAGGQCPREGEIP